MGYIILPGPRMTIGDESAVYRGGLALGWHGSYVIQPQRPFLLETFLIPRVHCYPDLRVEAIQIGCVAAVTGCAGDIPAELFAADVGADVLARLELGGDPKDPFAPIKVIAPKEPKPWPNLKAPICYPGVHVMFKLGWDSSAGPRPVQVIAIGQEPDE